MTTETSQPIRRPTEDSVWAGSKLLLDWILNCSLTDQPIQGLFVMICQTVKPAKQIVSVPYFSSFYVQCPPQYSHGPRMLAVHGHAMSKYFSHSFLNYGSGPEKGRRPVSSGSPHDKDTSGF